MAQDNADIIAKFKALNNEEKLRIVKLIAKEGENSITDIRNKLKLSFSTSHKYLNELENASILRSEIKLNNGRQKKLYSLKDIELNFNSVISPSKQDSTVQNLLIDMVNAEGLPEQISLNQLREKLMQIGVPVWLLDSILSKLSAELYDGISVSELESLILRIFLEEKKIFDTSIEKITSAKFFGDYSLQTILKQKNLEHSLKMYSDGHIDIYNIGTPKPVSISHDLRAVFKNGIYEQKPPKHSSTLVSYLRTVAEMSKVDIVGTQTFNHLNVYLAPFVSGLSYIQIKEMMENIIAIYKHIFPTMKGPFMYYSLDLTVPQHLKKQPAIGSKGKSVGIYGDFESESESIIRAFLESIEKTTNPRLIFNLYKGWENSTAIETLENIASNLTRPLFANLTKPWQNQASYSHEVIRLESPNTNKISSNGNSQTTTINLPRIAWQSKDESGFFEKLDTNIDACLDILKTSAESIGGKFHTSSSFISSKFGDEKYYDLDNATYTICTSGLNEVAKKVTGSELHENKVAEEFVMKVIKHMNSFINNKKMPFNVGIGEHIFKPVLERFAQKDVHDFGDKVFYQGDKKDPYYTPGTSVAENADLSLKDKIKIEEKFHILQKLGHQSIIRKDDKEIENILKIISRTNIGYFVLV